MKKLIVFAVVIIILLVIGTQFRLGPPSLTLQVDGRTKKTEQGTYCWGHKCVDMIHPVDLLQEKKAIVVAPGSEIKAKMSYKPNQAEISLTLFKNTSYSEDYPFTGKTFTAPTAPGIYYFALSYRWPSSKGENYSGGDSSYYFKLQVKDEQ